jgi:IS30 family transposase
MNKEIVEAKKQVTFVQQKANELVIETEADMAKGSDLLDAVKKVEKMIIEKKETITRPLMSALANARDLFRPLENAHAEAKKTIKAKMLAFTEKEEARIEAEKARIIARAEKGTYRVDTAVKKLEETGEAARSFSGSTGKTSIRQVTKVRIVDESLIPREYLVPDMPAITEAVLRKKIAVPGVETYQEKSIVGSSR